MFGLGLFFGRRLGRHLVKIGPTRETIHETSSNTGTNLANTHSMFVDWMCDLGAMMVGFLGQPLSGLEAVLELLGAVLGLLGALGYDFQS